jgi:hypothetical protein
MHPAVAYTLTAHTITPRPDGMRMSRARPFLEAAAQAMGVERLHVIDTGTEPAGGRDQWDDGSNVLAIGRRVAVSHERNSQTNARLEDAGVRVIRVPASELGSVRGGPRCMSCPVSRDPAAMPTRAPDAAGDGSRPLYRETLVVTAAEAATTAQPRWADAPVPAAACVPGSRPGAEPAQPGIPTRTATPARAGSAGEPVRAGSATPGAQEEELASASLGRSVPAAGRPLALSAGRPPADPEQPEGRPDGQDDQRCDKEHPQHVHDGNDHHYQDDRSGDQRQYAKHASTVRPSARACNPRASRGRPGGGRLVPARRAGRRSVARPACQAERRNQTMYSYF